MTTEHTPSDLHVHLGDCADCEFDTLNGIHFCLLHAAAPAMLDALKTLNGEHSITGTERARIAAIINRIEGETA